MNEIRVMLVFCWALVFGLVGSARADELSPRVRVISPSPAAVKVEILKAGQGELYAAVAENRAGPLPGERSLVAGYKPSASAGRTLFHYYREVDPFWTYPGWSDSPGGMGKLVQFALWRNQDGSWTAMIPLAGGGMVATLEGGGDEVLAVSQSLVDGFAPERVPLFALGRGEEPYGLVKALYRYAFRVMKEVDPEGIIGKLREEKALPEVFKYVGWCSWNAHYRGVSEAALLAHAASFKKAGFPIRWMLIDDGWQSVSRLTSFPWAQGGLYMTGFEANKKFPGGLSATARALKQDYGITWVGVWHTFQGYWNGVALDSELGRKYRDALMPVSEKAGIPDPRSRAGERFWEDWYRFLAESGIDFVKVDNQSSLAKYIKNIIPISRAMANSQRNLQGPAARHFHNNLINCMEMKIDVVYQWETTNIGRSSGDYVPILYNNPRWHVVKNVMNVLWISNLVYPDYDMWMTHDQHPEFHAVARAISGGPVYITDKAGRERFEYLWPLVFKDGRVIRVDEPGLPAVDCLLRDPTRERIPLKAFARKGESGILALWNANKRELSVKGAVSPSDVPGLSGDEFAVYEHFTGSLTVMSKDERKEVKLPRWTVRLYILTPMKRGFAAVGLRDKFIAPGAIEVLELAENRAKVKLLERGVLVAACKSPSVEVKVDGKALPLGKFQREGMKIEVWADDAESLQPVVEFRF